MKNRNIERLRNNGFNKLGVELAAFGGGPESELAFVDNAGVDKALLVLSLAGGLEHGGEGGDFAGLGQLGQLLLIIIVQDHVGAQDLLDHVLGFASEAGDGAVADDQDCDGAAAVNLLAEFGLLEVGVEVAELRLLLQQLGDVEGRGRRGEDNEEEGKAKDGRGFGLHLFILLALPYFFLL